jgi:hypothetical protein
VHFSLLFLWANNPLCTGHSFANQRFEDQLEKTRPHLQLMVPWANYFFKSKSNVLYSILLLGVLCHFTAKYLSVFFNGKIPA